MARPFSIDLRERVVLAVERDGLSCRQAAARFGVGVSTVIAWGSHYRRTGSFAPGKMGGNRPKKIAGAIGTGCSSAAGSGISPCAGLWLNWANAG
jgi:putative transposase